MIKQLTRNGDTLVLEFDRDMLDALNLNGDSRVEVAVKSGRVSIAPVHSEVDEKRRRIHEIHAEVMERHADTFRRLAE